MIVAVDVGNTNIKFGVYSGGKIIKNWTMAVHRNRTAAEYFSVLKALFDETGLDRNAITTAVVSSVVPSANFAIQETFESFFNTSPLFLTSTYANLLGIKVDLSQEFIGTDRLADLVAARTSWPDKDLLVIDMGTVTVFNLVSHTGSIYGQVLAPGLTCLTESMQTCTALLPQVRVCKSDHVIRDSTAASVESGIYWGYRSMVQGIVRQIILEEGKPLHVVATGGGSRLLSECDYIHDTDPLLTLRGILLIYEKLSSQRNSTNS